jgi:CBS domain-containing protein
MKHKLVRDLMLSLDEYATISSKDTIKQALLALSKSQLGLTQDRHYHRAVLVLKDGRVIGKLSHWAILRSLEPKFLKRDDESSLSRAGLTDEFIQSLKDTFSLFTGSLEQMCRAAGRIKAVDAMVPVGESIDEDATLTVAIRNFATRHTQSLLVTRNGEVVGILRLSDVFEEVADIIRNS